MFTVGEFARLAQVSKRLLRYYDQIGLLTPARVDTMTGFRYYSAAQMSELNRILALKELGLTLEQIQRLLRDDVSLEEMQGMLLLKKSEIEQQLRAELQRIRKIESRLHAIRSAGENRPLNVILKQVDAQPVMSLRTIVDSFESGLSILRQIRRVLPVKSGYGLCYCVCHSDSITDRDMDLELGCLIESKSHSPVPFNDLSLQFHELPAVETMATTVIQGPLETIHMGYADIAQWVELNGFSLAGNPREITLQMPVRADGYDLITEIQFPVKLLQSL